jgi:methionyl-tRNA formyltransferase
MSRSGISLLLADTMRSRAYAQALVHHGVSIDAVLIVRSPDRARWGQSESAGGAVPDLGSLFAPDLSVPLAETVATLGAPLEESEAGTINSAEVVDWIQKTGSDLIVFSGFGGELVRDDVLEAGVPLLHLHSGWLPDYRGSTTLYYSCLHEGSCGVTAILLKRDIDTGPILARKRYPPPPPGVEVDYLYDSAIRGDLLAETLALWKRFDGKPPLAEQPAEGTTYYIIHPLLKHLAIARFGSTGSD